MEHTEVKSENALNVILNYGNKVYYVNQVNVQVQEGNQRHKAIFHARRASDNQKQDLELEISQETYDTLLEYAKLDKMNLVLFLNIEGNDSQWCLMSENWLKKQAQINNKAAYIV